MIEASMVLYRHRIIAVSRGGPVSVEFDFDAVWAFKKSIPRADFHPDELLWMHVHPINFGTRPSHQDHLCAESLQIAFGEVTQFAIICFKDEDLNNAKGWMTVYAYEQKEFKVESEYNIDENIAYNDHLYILKTLAVFKDKNAHNALTMEKTNES